MGIMLESSIIYDLSPISIDCIVRLVILKNYPPQSATRNL